MLLSFLRWKLLLPSPPAAQPLWGRRISALIIGASLLLLGGCSALRFAYNQADDLVYWWLDAYVDFSDAQTPQARQAIGHWFDWHRRTQLPDYVALLQRAQHEVVQPASSAQVCRWWSELGQRRDALAEQSAQDLASLVITFRPEQIKKIERRYAKTNKDFAKDYLQEDPRDRRKAAIKRVVERSETLYGRLGDAQRALVARQLAGSPFDPQRWDAERRNRQRDILQTLTQLHAEQATRERALPVLRALLQRLSDSPDEGYRRYFAQLVAYNCEFAAQVHNSTSPAQRRAALEKLKGWEDDLRALMPNGP